MRGSPPDILLTNPEYLNMSFLGNIQLWQGFLQNLKFVVIDEMHEYRGFFGSNMALLLRRFFLQLERLGAAPRVFSFDRHLRQPGRACASSHGP